MGSVNRREISEEGFPFPVVELYYAQEVGHSKKETL